MGSYVNIMLTLHELYAHEISVNEAYKAICKAANIEVHESPICNNCGNPYTQKTYEGWWCNQCHNEMILPNNQNFCTCIKDISDGADVNGNCIHCGKSHNPLPNN